MKYEEEREIRRCAACGREEMRCTGIDVVRGSRQLEAARYRCKACNHAIVIRSGAAAAAIMTGVAALVFIGVPVRVFVHEMIQLSGGPEGHGWYEWLVNGGILLAGLLLGGGMLFIRREFFVSVYAALRNPVVGTAPPPGG